MLLAHGPLAVILVERINRKLSQGIVPFIFMLTLICGILPDFDFFILAAQSKPAYLHHNLITHTPIFWITVTILVYIGLKLVEKYSRGEIKSALKNGGTYAIALSVFIGTMSHILSDTLTGHIMLLYPLTKLGYTLGADLFPINPIVTYFIHPAMIIESSIVAWFLFLLAKKVIHIEHPVYNLLTKLSTVVIFLFALSSLYLYANTYLAVLPKHPDHMINYDIDNDSVEDYQDFDIDNDGIDNIKDAEGLKVAKAAREIAQSGKLADFKGAYIKDLAGYITPYGLLSTSYYLAGYTLEPVIKRENKEDSNLRFDLKTFYTLLSKRDSVLKFTRQNTDPYVGKPLFVINDGKILSAGIIVSNDEIAIVLPADKRLKVHTFNEIEKAFGEITLEVGL
ncbi:MAG: hypothetical protein UT34_C0001G0390 [candidate division WS6 bacterium GW2011_GWF2_39_15]|uniref:Membrane-bound metal-dependent hydrolase n=1 Tax=candidate division WS6 bacterium GW2011_GWF2_39_15 TaxID=1619100 RepID=A0A0G0Q7D8_9BACT|nr:MAG: hypothetical protein UT34_C0001G0390 [candidate division WS6 bacterium GW2011_GWF2_39_15]